MEFVTLNSNYGSAYLFQPERLIENYDSLIWGERYGPAGDFQLISSHIEETLSRLPLETYVSLRESTVPMIVEAHKIEKPKNKPARLIVEGRSFESVLERRATVSSLVASATPPRSAWTVSSDANKSSDAAYKAMRQVLGDQVPRSNLPAVTMDPALVGDRIPEINLPLPTDYTTGVGTTYEIKPGDLYSVVQEMLSVNHHGLRAIRPLVEGKLTVDLEIYNGADLRDSVVFDARFDQIDGGTYFLSHQTSKNVAYIYGPNGATKKLKNTGPEPTGLKRRVILVDGMGENSLNTDANRQNRGLVELYDNNSTALFDGEVAQQVAEKFNKPQNEGGYGLGDIVRLNGDYGMTRDVRVVEFIRTSDSSGESAYPTFEVVDE